MADPILFELNALGLRLYASKPATSWFGSETMATALAGTSGNDALYGTGYGSVLTGGAGDDTYHLWDIRDRVIEAFGAGRDTLVIHAPDYAIGYALPANVENLGVESRGGWGVGNGLDNLIIGDIGRQWLAGGAGYDVLTGGAGSDVFVARRGMARDVVTDFAIAEDVFALGDDFSLFRNFASVQAALSQTGVDVALDLGGGDGMLFRNRQISDFTAANFSLPVNRLTLKQTFGDEFDTFFASPTGLRGEEPAWRTTYWWGRTIPTNHEGEFYTDVTTGRNPFSLSDDGILTINASAAINLPNGLTHTSGVITTETSHVQTYGYFEMRASLPSGQGFWPAFWLLPANGDWPPEIDVMEMLGSNPGILHVNAHSKASNTNDVSPAVVPLTNLSAGFNTFAVSWRPDMIRWYLDGLEVHAIQTPADMHQPMYMIANLAVGADGSWPGATPASASAAMKIDYIHAYQYQDLPSPTNPVARSAVYRIGTPTEDILSGSDSADRIVGGRGNDTLSGGTGADVFVLAPGDGKDVVRDFQVGVDTLLIQGVSPSSIMTTSANGGIEISYGADKLKLLGVGSVPMGDVVAGAAAWHGTSGSEFLDRSSSSRWQTLYGQGGNDTLHGGFGRDWIDGGSGADKLSGGLGADSFAFQVGAGDDRIDDFQSGVDRLVFVGVSASTIHVNFARMRGVDGLEVDYGQPSVGTTVDHGTETDSIFLANVQALEAGDIILA